MIAGDVTTLAPGLRRVLAGNAGMMTGPGTNTYLLGTREIAVVDPGPADPVHLRALLNAAADTAAAIRWILVTHTHRDHSPLARELAHHTGACLIGLPPPDDGRQDESFRPDRVPVDGAQMLLGTLRVTAIHTPGHASNCLCYLLEDTAVLLTGDHILGGVSPVILPPDGSMAAYLASLDKLNGYDFEHIAPGHGDIMPRGTVIAQLREHRLAREAKVLARLAQSPDVSLEHLTALVYDDVPVERHGFAQLTLQAHLIKLLREARVTEHEARWRALRA